MRFFKGKSKRIDNLNYYKNTLDEILGFIVRFNCNYEITFINKSLLTRFNVEEDEVLSSHFLDWIHPDSKKQIRQALFHIDSSNQCYDCETKDKVLPGDMKEVWRLWRIKGIINKEKHLSEYLAIGTELANYKELSGKQIEVLSGWKQK